PMEGSGRRGLHLRRPRPELRLCLSAEGALMGDTAILDHYLAPLRPLLEPDDVTELVVNRPGEVGVERDGRWAWSSEPRLSEPWLRTLAVAAAAYTRQD